VTAGDRCHLAADPAPVWAPDDNMTCCRVWDPVPADSQPLRQRRRRRADGRTSAPVEETRLQE
jgi:hypothetical protein